MSTDGLERPTPRIVALGGGTGLATLLRGAKRVAQDVTAVVTVSDDGGSSGRLRDELGVLPPGDIRNCLVALADDESLMSALFSHRFSRGGLGGHSFGNLFLAALTEVTGDFDLAVQESSRVLAIRGTVLPSTTQDIRLLARLADGRLVAGESAIGRATAPVARVWLDPDGAEALPAALGRIRSADVVVLGPGSLFTSIVPNLLVQGVREALAQTDAKVVYVANVMTQQGETAGFGPMEHLDGLLGHLGEGIVDYMVVNRSPIPASIRARYEAEGAEPVLWTGDGAVHRGVTIVPEDVAIVEDGDHLRHDPDDLVRAVLALTGIGRRHGKDPVRWR